MMKKIIALILTALILLGGTDAFAQGKKKKTSKKKEQSTELTGRQRIRQSNYATFDKFTSFNTKSDEIYFSPFNYTDFLSLIAGKDPEWGEDFKPVMNYLEKVSRATMTMYCLFAINPEITDPSQRNELVKTAIDEANASIKNFETWRTHKKMRNKFQFRIAEIDYRYFKGTNYYNEQRGDDIIHAGVLLYFGSKKKAIISQDTTSRTFPDIKFFPNDATILESWNVTIDELANYLKENDTKGVLLTGYSDNQGTDAYITGISRQRATEVKKALLLRGIDPRRIEMEVKGDEDPIGDNSTYDGRIENNRVSIKIQ
jgi:outer membrane protein OmpA-like peptidoglycan-associated protein